MTATDAIHGSTVPPGDGGAHGADPAPASNAASAPLTVTVDGTRPHGGASDRLSAIFSGAEVATVGSPNRPASFAAADLALVLLVDDRRDKLMAMQAVLEGLGDGLLLARSGKEALSQVLNNSFAVILLDVNMPIMNGYETAALIRQRKASAHTPIIFITAHNRADTQASHGYALGAVDYIFAPVNPEVIRAKVSAFIDLFRKSREVRRQDHHLHMGAERRAAVLESQLDRLLNRLNVGVYRASPAGNLLSANPAFLRTYAIDPAADIRTMTLASLYLHAEDRPRMESSLAKGQPIQDHQVRQRRSDGTIFWASVSEGMSEDSDGMRCIEGLVEDITIRKEAEEALKIRDGEIGK
jgi:PAS domain S-box-containing protein